MVELFMLGTGGTYPLVTRSLASSLIRVGGKGILIDCGEATQIEMQKITASFIDMSYICITHMHADHVSGLLGMLLALKTSEKKDLLTIIGPRNIKKYVESMFLITPKFGYPIKFIELDLNGPMCDIVDGDILIKSVSANHTVPCFSYSIELLRKARFLVEKSNSFGIPAKFRGVLSRGKDLELNGVIYKSSDFVSGPRKGLKISYVTDTRPTKSLYDFISNSDIAIIEGMYRSVADLERAKQKKHMIWDESVSLVKNNKVKELILTHYSPSLQIERGDSDLLSSKCPFAVLGKDGLYRFLKYDDSDATDATDATDDTDDTSSLKKTLNPPFISNVEDRSAVIVEALRKDGVLKSYTIKEIVRINTYKYRVIFEGLPYTCEVVVYKKFGNMKNVYISFVHVSEPEDYYVFFTR